MVKPINRRFFDLTKYNKKQKAKELLENFQESIWSTESILDGMNDGSLSEDAEMLIEAQFELIRLSESTLTEMKDLVE